MPSVVPRDRAKWVARVYVRCAPRRPRAARYSTRTTRPFTAGDKGSFTLNGLPIVPGQPYRIVTNAFLAGGDKAQASDTLWLSLISVWEVAKKTGTRQLVLDRPLDDWFDLATTRPGLHLAELTRHILSESCRLPPPFHGDPVDQIIVATARDRDAVIVTKDRQIRDYVPVRSIW